MILKNSFIIKESSGSLNFRSINIFSVAGPTKEKLQNFSKLLKSEYEEN